MSFEELQHDTASQWEEDTNLLGPYNNALVNEKSHGEICCCHRMGTTTKKNTPASPKHPVLLLVASLASISVLLAFFFRSRLSRFPDDPTRLNNYFRLAEYTTTWVMEGDEKTGEGTLEAAESWQRYLDTDGVVAIPHTWAQQHGLPFSEPHPERPDHGVYQIDLWHSLHCLYRIRNRITSHVPIDEHPRDDEHTLHCLDYLRQQAMCNADTTLQPALSNEKVANQCKDFGAIQGWVRDHGWPGYRAYMWPIMAAEAEAAANGSRTSG